MFFTGHKVNIGQFSHDNTETLIGDYMENTKNSPKDAGNESWTDVERYARMNLWWKGFHPWTSVNTFSMSPAAQFHRRDQMRSSATDHSIPLCREQYLYEQYLYYYALITSFTYYY